MSHQLVLDGWRAAALEYLLDVFGKNSQDGVFCIGSLLEYFDLLLERNQGTEQGSVEHPDCKMDYALGTTYF